MVPRRARRCATLRSAGALAARAARDGAVVLRFPRRQARGGRLLPPRRQAAGHAAQLAQDVRTWWGMVVRLVEGPRVKVQTRKRVKQNKPDRGPPGPQSGAE